MRIFITELKKLFSGRVFLLIIAAIFIINAYLMFRMSSSDDISPDDYKAVYSAMSGMTDTQKLEWLDKQCSDFSEERQYNWDILYELRDECSQIVNYREYLDSINSQADSMTSISIFAKPDTFNYRSIAKTPSAYKKMKNVVPVFDVSKGVILATDNNFTDILIGFIVLFAVISLMISDRENGMSGLLFSLRHGRSHILLTKLLVLTVTIFATVFLIYLENFIIAEYIYGLGYLSRPVQSISGFIGCNLKINVLQYLILYVIFKFFALFVIGSLLSLIAVNTKNTVSFYGLSAIIFIAEGVCYANIHPLSIYSIFRYINLISFTKLNEIFSNYKNINFWEYPVPLIPVSMSAVLIIAFVCFVLSAALYAKKRNLEFHRIGIHFKFSKNNSVHSAIYYTLYKSLVQQRGLAVIILGVLTTGFFNSSFVKKYDVSDVYYKYYAELIEGEISDETDEFMVSETLRFDNLKAKADELIQISNDFSAELNDIQKQLAPSVGFYLLKERYDGIKDLENAQIFYDTGYKRMFGKFGYDDDMKFALAAVLICIFLISPLIANDNKYGMHQVINSTKSGKISYIKRNVIIASMYGFIATLLWIIPYYIVIGRYYGYSGLNAPIQSIIDFRGFPINITVKTYLITVFTLRTIFIILTSMTMLWISSKCKNSSSALIINFAVFALPIIIYLFGAKVMIKTGFNTIISVNSMINDFSIMNVLIPIAFFILICISKLLKTRKQLNKYHF